MREKERATGVCVRVRQSVCDREKERGCEITQPNQRAKRARAQKGLGGRKGEILRSRGIVLARDRDCDFKLTHTPTQKYFPFVP